MNTIKPNKLIDFRDLEAAWDAAEYDADAPKNSSGGGVKVEISSPRLENTTFKGETRSLASAARIQQQQRAIRSQRPAVLTVGAKSAVVSAPGGALTRNKQPSGKLIEPTKPDISAPTLQASTYKHNLIELPEAFSTLKNAKKSKKPKSTPGYSALQPKQ